LVGTRDSQAKHDRKAQELELADVIFVPSLFVRDSLPKHIHDTRRCYIVEFGSPLVSPDAPASTCRDHEEGEHPLRVLFAGSMSQRKGLADVFAAMRQVQRRDVELVVMGSPIAPMEFYRSQNSEFRYETPRPHAQVLELMQSCDVLLLPSIAEGRALVQQEAMACGLPLIVTPNAGGQDLIEEGRTGFLVPIRSPASIAEKIHWLADHREALPEMRLAARAKALEYSWESYGRKIVHKVQTCLGS
jgi:glycosyltransferase involved in cell wall biosynthesis